MARRPVKTTPPAEPAKPPRDPITLPDAASWTSDARTLAVNITILLAIVLIIPVIATQFWRNQVVIAPILVPDAIQSSGLTPEVAAGRLWDGLQAIGKAANTAKDTVVSIPESAKVDFAIPDSGLSIDGLVYYVRQFFNAYETRITGEFRCGDADCTAEAMRLRLRVVRKSVDMIDMPPRGTMSEDAYFAAAAAEVMSYLDPFTALAAISDSNPTRAKVLARRLIRTNHPDAKWAYNLLGNLLRNDGDLPGGIEQFRAALAIDPEFPPALANLGDALRTQNDLAGARTAFDRVLARNKDDVYALKGYADLKLAENDLDGAIAYLLKAAAVRPLPPIYLDLAGNMMLGQNRMEEAETFFKQALEVDPGDTMALATLAYMYMNAEKYDDAERVYRAAADFAPQDAGILAMHSSMLRTVHKFDEALERAQRAIAIAPDKAEFHEAAAKSLLDLARYDEALLELAEADRLGPNDPDIFMTFGDIYRMKGESSAAIAAYNRYMELAPEDLMRPVAEMYVAMLGKPPAPAEPEPTPPAPEPASASPIRP